MKQLYIIFAILFCQSISTAFSQSFNINPNLEGDPWIAGGATPSTPEVLSTIPLLIPNSHSYAKGLPDKVDNSILKYFPNVFLQKGHSCSQAAGIGYCFTYELNRIRNSEPKGRYDQTPIESTDNLFAYLHTYNLLNC